MSDLPAGAELDRLVAEKVFGLTIGDDRWLGWYEDAGIGHYSTRIEHAWMVVEKLIGSLPEGDLHIEHHGDTGWGVSSCYGGKHWDDWVFAETLPLAICRAALAAIDYDDNFGDTYSEAERS